MTRTLAQMELDLEELEFDLEVNGADDAYNEALAKRISETEQVIEQRKIELSWSLSAC